MQAGRVPNKSTLPELSAKLRRISTPQQLAEELEQPFSVTPRDILALHSFAHPQVHRDPHTIPVEYNSYETVFILSLLANTVESGTRHPNLARRIRALIPLFLANDDNPKNVEERHNKLLALSRSRIVRQTLRKCYNVTQRSIFSAIDAIGEHNEHFREIKHHFGNDPVCIELQLYIWGKLALVNKNRAA